MTWVDLVVIAVLAVSAMLAFMRGLVREVLGIGAWIGAGAAATWGVPLARTRVHGYFGDSPWADPATFAAIFIVVLILLIVVAHGIGRAVRGSPLGGLDRTLGLLFGLARGAVLVMLAYIIAGMVVPVDQWPQPVQQARLIYPAFQGANWIVHLLPADHQPAVHPPPAGPDPTTDALMHAAPLGSALNKPAGGQ